MAGYGPSGFTANNVTGNFLSGQRAADASQANMQQYQQNILNQQRVVKQDEEQAQTKAAQQLFLASQYALQAPPGQTKAFVEQNFPDLVTHAGPKWATATEDDVRSELQGAAAKFGSQVGVGPAQPKERALINTVGPDGKPVRGEDRPGVPVYVAPEKSPPRFRAMSPAEIKSYGLPDNSSAQINDTTGQIQVLDKPAAGPSARGTFKDTQALRKEFDNLPEVKNYKLVLPLYERAKNAPPTRAGDLSIIYALGKMFDPGSVVREGELILAQNTAPWLVKMVSSANSQLTGDGAMSPETRTAILAALDGQKQALEQPYNQERERFAGYADENGWNPSSVVGKYTPSEAFTPPAAATPAATTQAPVQVKSDAEFNALPSGTEFIAPDGSHRRKP